MFSEVYFIACIITEDDVVHDLSHIWLFLENLLRGINQGIKKDYKFFGF